MTSFSHILDAQNSMRMKITAELVIGSKQTHWMWFVFPQLKALGKSGAAKHFGIIDIEDAREYMSHPVLGPRLLNDIRHVLSHKDKPIYQILGDIDGKKFQSCLTLFSKVSDRPEFKRALDVFYNGIEDVNTLNFLKG